MPRNVRPLSAPAKSPPRKRPKPEPEARQASRPPASDRQPVDPAQRWPVWAAVVLTVLYIGIHLYMIPVALTLWGGLLSALVLGR